ncbi:MAG: hypothetical protein VKJ09_09760 [Leptolyngbya sp.]|nr:hypothetical protein [Leptolyngbya sp.]
MKTAVSQSPMEALKTAMHLAQSVEKQAEAHEVFHELHESVRTENPEYAAMLQLLWRDYVAAQRSAAFWQELCQVEKHLSERITESHIQLKQNYMRLMQEQ